MIPACPLRSHHKKKVSSHLTGLYLFLIAFSGCSGAQPSAPVQTGADVLMRSYYEQLSGLRVGAVVNHTATVDDRHLIDTLLSVGIDVVSVFAPEHGFRGDNEAGANIESGKDPLTGIPIYSLYGTVKKPTQDMLQEVDLLLFDMQDVGARFYTYNSTLRHVIESAASNGKPVWILDRPNPAGGSYVSGWILEDEHSSFVGSYPIPIAHGLTLGELALMALGEKWIVTEGEPEVRVIPMEGWQRSMIWPETGLTWTPPSPNLPTFEHAYMYLGTCLIEGTNLSEGRGTDDPFLLVGMPDMEVSPDSIHMIAEKYGIRSMTETFIPKSKSGFSINPKYKDEQVEGFRFNVGEKYPSDPVSFGVELTRKLVRSNQNANYSDFIYKLAGTRKIVTSDSVEWSDDVEMFKVQREPYLLYD